MIISVTEQYHDYSPQMYFIDTDKLNPENYVDSLILKECEKKSHLLKVNVDAKGWDDPRSVFKGTEPIVSQEAKFEILPQREAASIHKSLMLTIRFDY